MQMFLCHAGNMISCPLRSQLIRVHTVYHSTCKCMLIFECCKLTGLLSRNRVKTSDGYCAPNYMLVTKDDIQFLNKGITQEGFCRERYSKSTMLIDADKISPQAGFELSAKSSLPILLHVIYRKINISSKDLGQS